MPTSWPVLLTYLQVGRTHLAGISFGGVVALDFRDRHGEQLAGLAVMSSFAELTPQLELLGNVLYEGLTQVGPAVPAEHAVSDEHELGVARPPTAPASRR
jgi:pimeloyl-ACP methyl ester carboxylesterase